jgi:pSer/pThr/pTyr-binding forkhead associated (FHA) protein
MKLNLVVQSPGPNQGKVLDIKLSQFVVGRDPQCHLRPASPMISKRHCAVLQREGKAFVRDFDSTNGTFVNNEPVKGEVELHHGDQLKIGPLLFEVRIDATAPVNRPTPPPPTRAAAKTVKPDRSQTPVPPSAAKTEPAQEAAAADDKAKDEPAAAPTATDRDKFEAGSSNDDDIAAMLLSLHDDTPPGSSGMLPEVPEGSTVHEMPLPPEVAAQMAQNEKEKEKEKPKPSGNTSSAAKSILEKYMRRPRG